MPTIIILPAIIIMIAGVHIALPYAIKSVLRRKFLDQSSKSPHVFLTFDDGPNPLSTPLILDLLKQHDAKATFFLLGKFAEKHPDLVNRIRDQGHAIGEHGYAHVHAWKSDPFTTALDLQRGRDALGQQVTQLFRPPFGKFNLATIGYIIFAKKQVAFWDVDPKDYQASSSQVVAAHVIQRLMPGSVILLHDGSYDSDRTYSHTVEALRIIMDSDRARGLSFATLDSLISPGD